MHTIKYNLYPNNELRATHYYRAPSKSVNEDDSVLDGVLSCPETAPSPAAEEASTRFPTLDISSDFAQAPPSQSRKRTKFGINAKRTILRLGGAYDTVDNTPSNYVFLTGTIPGGTHHAFMAMAEQASYVAHSVANWFQRTAKTQHWFYVWELQKRGALHIHYCLHAPNPNIREKILRDWHSKWESIIQEVGRKAGADMWLRADGTHHREGHSVLQAYAQTVQKSVAAYMAGYCSSDKNKHSQDGGSPYYPSRWWGCSRASTKLLKGLTETIIVQHTNYRDAKYEMQLHYERVLHDSPKAHHYQHKVGIGSTVVSYHPEDKGYSQWLTLNPMLYNNIQHPNTWSTIALFRRMVLETVFLLEASPKQARASYEPLLTTLRDLTFPTAVRGYTMHHRDFRIALSIPSELNLPASIQPEWARLWRNWMLLQASLKFNHPKLIWDRHGYLCNCEDLFCGLDDIPGYSYLSTTDPNGEGAVPGAANGSLSPPNSLTFHQPCLFSDLSESP